MIGLRLTGALILVLGALAGCTPADEPIAALAVRDGQPVGLLYACRDSSYAGLTVYEDPPETATDDHLYASWHVLGKAKAGVVEIPLLGSLPAGWAVSAHPATSTAPTDQRDLKELTDGMRYTLRGNAHRKSIPISFSTADFPGVGADQVLAATGQDRTKVVSRAAFLRKARESCD